MSAVEPHAEPVEILPDVLFVQGSVRMGPGIRVNRNMVALRDGGELTLLDPIRLSPGGEAALERFGRVRHVVRLGAFHGRDDAWAVERFGARFWCQPGSDVYPEPPPDVLIAEDGEVPLPDARFFVFRGTRKPECALLWRRHGRLLVTCDAVQHWPDTAGCSLLGKAVTRALGFVHPANIGPPWRRLMTPPGGSLRGEFERLCALRFEHLVGAHGQPLLGGADAALRRSIERIYG